MQYGATRIIAGEMSGGHLILGFTCPVLSRCLQSSQSQSIPLYAGGDVLTVLFSVLMGGMSLGQAAPLLQVVSCVISAQRSD